MIKTIGHTAYDCYNFEATLDFYTRVLRFEEMFRLYDDDDALWIIYLRVNDEVFLELFPKSGDAPAAKDARYSHLCLEVDDIEIMKKELEEAGVPLDTTIQGGKDGNLQLWAKDPEGNRIEFMQIAPNSLQRRAIERIKGTKIGA